MSGLEALYQELIVDHSKHPRGQGLAEPFDGESFQVNPMCGDQIRLRVVLDPAGGPGQVTWDGRGCAISQASASVMSELVAGASADEAERLRGLFVDLMHSRGEGVGEEAEEALGDAIAFEGVSRYPARVKCALLGWMALQDALVKARAGDSSPARIPEGWS